MLFPSKADGGWRQTNIAPQLLSKVPKMAALLRWLLYLIVCLATATTQTGKEAL
jgi:hypothetical protein